MKSQAEGSPKRRISKRKLKNKQLILPGLAATAALLVGTLYILQPGEGAAVTQNTATIENQTQDAARGNTDSQVLSSGLEDQTQPVDVKSGKTATSVSSAAGTKTGVKKQGSLFVIIDDVGNSIDELKPFLSLPFSVTLAVMPGRPYTDAAVSLIASSGKPYIIHQPMEPMGDANPGERAVMSTMTSEEIKVLVRENIAAMPGALGMNNHMGSKITADAEKLLPVLEVLKEKKLVFIDSVTSGQTKGRAVAESLGLAFSKRNTMFLDNEQDRKSIEEMVIAAKGVAAREGHAVMIGHVWSSELADLLLDLYPSLLEDGYELKDVRDLLVKGSEQ